MDSATYVRDGIEEAVTCLMWCFGRKKCPPEVVGFRLARGEFRFFFFFLSSKRSAATVRVRRASPRVCATLITTCGADLVSDLKVFAKQGEFRFLEFFDVVQKVGGDGARPASVTSSLCDPNYDLWRRFSAGLTLCRIACAQGFAD